MLIERRLPFGLAIAGLALFFAFPAHADNMDDCERSLDIDEKIRACSAIIDAGTDTQKNIAIAYEERGSAYSRKGDLLRAQEDGDRSLKLDPSMVGYEAPRLACTLLTAYIKVGRPVADLKKYIDDCNKHRDPAVCEVAADIIDQDIQANIVPPDRHPEKIGLTCKSGS